MNTLQPVQKFNNLINNLNFNNKDIKADCKKEDESRNEPE